MMDGDVDDVVPLAEHAADALQLGLGHALVGLVLQPDHVAAARARPGRARERRDRAGVVGGHLGDDGLERERLPGEPIGPARDRRDERHLVSVREGVPRST